MRRRRDAQSNFAITSSGSPSSSISRPVTNSSGPITLRSRRARASSRRPCPPSGTARWCGMALPSAAALAKAAIGRRDRPAGPADALADSLSSGALPRSCSSIALRTVLKMPRSTFRAALAASPSQTASLLERRASSSLSMCTTARKREKMPCPSSSGRMPKCPSASLRRRPRA